MQSVKLAACAWSVAVAAVAASSATQAQATAGEAPVEAPLGPQVSQAEAAAPADAASQDLPAPAAADTSEADEAAASEAAGDARTDGGIEEVVVTAQRRKEKLQDVPVTITAFTAEQLSEARIVAVQDVATRTPGLVFDAFPSSQPRLAVRGIGSSDRGAAGDPSSAVFLDEVYLGRPAAVAFDAFDVERVEVLKGPQGTLYGRNVVGGAVNVITRKPDFTKFDAGAQVTVGNYARAEDAGFVNVPFADGKAAIRVAGAVRQHDGYTENNFTGGRQDDQDDRSLRVQLAYNPQDSLRLLFSLDGTRSRAAGPGQHVVDRDPSSPYAPLWTIDRNRNYTAGSFEGYLNKETWGSRLQGDLDLSFATLTYLGSYRELDYRESYDFDGGNPSTNRIAISGGAPEKSHFYSNELRLSSLPESSIRWVAGLFTFTNDTNRRDTLILDTGRGPGTETYHQDATLDSYAAYGDVTIPVGEMWHVIGGIRYSKDEKDYALSNTEGPNLFRASERFDLQLSDSWDAVTYRVGGDFKPFKDHLLYAMVSRGFKSGGFSDTPGAAAEASQSFKPEYATNYEIGQKSSFFGGRLVWNNTLYWMDYTDLQTINVLPDLTKVTKNAGAATIKGYETYFNWRPFAGANLMTTYAWTDGTFDKYDFSPEESYAGNRLTRLPRSKVVVSPSYDVLASSGAIVRLAADYRYESKIYDDDSNVGPEFRPPTHFVDARVIYISPSDHWTVSFWGQNLTDETTRVFQGTFLGATFAAYNPPRTYGMTLTWNL